MDNKQIEIEAKKQSDVWKFRLESDAKFFEESFCEGAEWYRDKHANITAETAIGFKIWSDAEYPCKFFNKYAKHNSPDWYTTSELFTIYINQL